MNWQAVAAARLAFVVRECLPAVAPRAIDRRLHCPHSQRREGPGKARCFVAKVRPMVRETGQRREASAPRPLVVKDRCHWVVGQFEWKTERHKIAARSTPRLQRGILLFTGARNGGRVRACRTSSHPDQKNPNRPGQSEQSLEDSPLEFPPQRQLGRKRLLP